MDIHFTLNGDSFVWNAAKAEKNLRKHGVRFEEAAAVFGDPAFIRIISARRADSEEESHYAV